MAQGLRETHLEKKTSFPLENNPSVYDTQKLFRPTRAPTRIPPRWVGVGRLPEAARVPQDVQRAQMCVVKTCSMMKTRTDHRKSTNDLGNWRKKEEGGERKKNARNFGRSGAGRGGLGWEGPSLGRIRCIKIN